MCSGSTLYLCVYIVWMVFGLWMYIGSAVIIWVGWSMMTWSICRVVSVVLSHTRFRVKTPHMSDVGGGCQIFQVLRYQHSRKKGPIHDGRMVSAPVTMMNAFITYPDGNIAMQCCVWYGCIFIIFISWFKNHNSKQLHVSVLLLCSTATLLRLSWTSWGECAHKYTAKIKRKSRRQGRTQSSWLLHTYDCDYRLTYLKNSFIFPMNDYGYHMMEPHAHTHTHPSWYFYFCEDFHWHNILLSLLP